MRLKSIHLRLTLSFAMIALVTAVVLGGVLLAVLQGYYTNLEASSLRANAQTIGGLVTALIAEGTAPDEVQSQIEYLAPEIQRRIQVYGPDAQLLYDSGPLTALTPRWPALNGCHPRAMPSSPVLCLSRPGVSETART